MIIKNKIFIIAEAGVNHNGSLQNAFKLIDLASKAGADFIAVSGGVWGYEHGPEEAVKTFNALFLSSDES